MDYNEILEKIKTLYPEVKNFAFDEPVLPEDFQLSEDLAKRKREFEAYMTKYNELYKELKKSRDKTHIERVQAIKDKIGERPLFNYRDRIDEYLKVNDIEFEEVDSYGGEGQGEVWYVVYYFKNHDVYIKVDGFYHSYPGVEFCDGWDSCSEVKPKTVKKVVYEKV